VPDLHQIRLLPTGIRHPVGYGFPPEGTAGASLEARGIGRGSLYVAAGHCNRTCSSSARRWAKLRKFFRTGENLSMSDRADRPWMMRTYSGHSSAEASNELYRGNLSKGQTGLSIAFDLPTQTGYDPDSPMARGEVGKVGVPVAHLGHMRTLLDQIPPDRMNTSMTINATAACAERGRRSRGSAASPSRGCP
jgi:hypothetical protein